MATIHKLTSDRENNHSWEGTRTREYKIEDGNVLETWLIGKAENSQNFALRYYNLSVGSSTLQESHAHDHGIYIIHGEALVHIENEKFETATGDVIYIPPNVEHQINNNGENNLGFLCIIPAKRTKDNQEVWAETGLFEE